MPTRSTHSIPQFSPFSCICGAIPQPPVAQGETFFGFTHMPLWIVEFVGKNCSSSNTTFLTSAHGGHRETYGCPDPTPFSALSRRSRRMIRPFRSPLPGASHHLPPSCALLAPKSAPRFKPHPELSPQPHANYRHTNPLLPVVNYSPSSRSLSQQPNTIQFA